MVQKLTTYEHYHPDLYQEKFKHHVNMAQADDSDEGASMELSADLESAHVVLPVLRKKQWSVQVWSAQLGLRRQ